MASMRLFLMSYKNFNSVSIAIVFLDYELEWQLQSPKTATNYCCFRQL